MGRLGADWRRAQAFARKPSERRERPAPEGVLSDLQARQRFGEVVAILREGPHSAWHVAQHMKWSRPWDDIAGFMRRAAVGEAVSHLRVLEIDGLVQVQDGEPELWSLTERATI